MIGLGPWRVPDPFDVLTDDGLIAVSFYLTPEMYQRMYVFGIFPWFEQDSSYYWFSPPTRSVTKTKKVNISKSMRPYINKGIWRFSVNTNFKGVLDGCKTVERPGQNGSWISDEFYRTFLEMHEEGMAHSFEVWDGNELIGGTFGVMTGKVFVGESMFHTKTNASKFAYIGMCQYLDHLGVDLLDNQLPTQHLNSLGAKNWEKAKFLWAMYRRRSETLFEVPSTHDFRLHISRRKSKKDKPEEND